MRVLYFGADSVSAAVRIRPLLESLCRTGHIEGFACVDRNMALEGDAAPYDVVLVHRNPGSRQIAWLQRSGLPFVYDVDDLMLRDPVPVDSRRAREQAAMRWCLAHAHCITSPSRRLLRTLELWTEQPFGERAVYLPNPGFPPVARPAREVTRPSLLWVSSHGEHYDEFCDIGAGMAAAARSIGCEVMLIGRFAESVRAAIPNHIHVPWLEPDQYRQFIASGPFIAAAPLPLGLPDTEQEFVECKSDIKAAQFCSLGIAAAYSPSPPYAESDLPCALVPTNAAADWQDRLMELAGGFPGEGMTLAQDPTVVGRGEQIVAQQLHSVLARVRDATGRQFFVRSVPTPSVLRRMEQRFRSLRTRLLS
ncbi:MAG: glycosyltransferase [Xanthobacteraceae bacterium]